MKIRKIGLILAVLLAVLLAASAAGAEGDREALNGTWHAVDNDELLTFYEDGSILKYSFTSTGLEQWKLTSIESGRLTMEMDAYYYNANREVYEAKHTRTVTYTLSEDRNMLTLAEIYDEYETSLGEKEDMYWDDTVSVLYKYGDLLYGRWENEDGSIILRLNKDGTAQSIIDGVEGKPEQLFGLAVQNSFFFGVAELDEETGMLRMHETFMGSLSDDGNTMTISQYTYKMYGDYNEVQNEDYQTMNMILTRK